MVGFLQRRGLFGGIGPQTLLGLASGIGSGDTLGEGLGPGFALAARGLEADRKQVQDTRRRELFRDLASDTTGTFGSLSPQVRALAAESPDFAQSLVLADAKAKIASRNAKPVAKFGALGGDRVFNRFTGEVRDIGGGRPGQVAGFKPPKGFRVKLDTQGQPVVDQFGRPEVEPIPGGPQARLPAETAGRLAFAKEGLAQLDNVERFFQEGKFTAGARIQQVLGVGEVGRLQRDVGIAIEAALRAATGAAAPEQEFQRFRNFFAPSADDTVTTAVNKIQRLRRLTARIAQDISRGRGGPGQQALAILDRLAREFNVPDASGGGGPQAGAESGLPAIAAPTPSLGLGAPAAPSTTGQGQTRRGTRFRLR